MIKLLVTSVISLSAYSFVGADFSASASLVGTGANTNFNSHDSANAHALPAILAETDKSLFSFSIVHSNFSLDPINNIIVSSEVNSTSAETNGNIQPSVQNISMLMLHSSSKIFKKLPGKFNFSLYAPLDKAAQADTTDPYLPDYPLMKKYERIMLGFSYAIKRNSYSFSLGALTGIQSSGEALVFAKQTGNPTPTIAEVSQNIKPSLALSFSVHKKWKDYHFSFKFQDENKSNIENNTDAFLAPASGSNLTTSWKVSSQLFYDPRTYHFGFKKKYYSFFLEYQDWKGYQSPIIKLEQEAGGLLRGSNEERNYTVQNIIIPSFVYSSRFNFASYDIGIKHRPSPLKLDNNKNGNAIDLDATILSLGLSKKIRFFGDEFNASFGLQYHKLHSERVNKQGNRENGNAGNKIGSGGYDASGHIIATSFGLNWVI